MLVDMNASARYIKRWGRQARVNNQPTLLKKKNTVLGRDEMYKVQNSIKSGLVTIVAAAIVSLASLPSANAATYTYNMNSASTNMTGTITTSCDDCVLNASNITAWNLSVVPSIPGGFSISSSSPGAQLVFPKGDTDMTATPSGISFLFSGLFGGESFETAAYIFGLGDGQGAIGAGPAGVIEACSLTIPGRDGCAFVESVDGILQMASVAVPFTGSVNYSFTGKVTGATGIYASAGTTVSGTLTFDLNAGDGALPVSMTTPWSSVSTGTAQVVASTLQSGSVSFTDAGAVSNKTMVAGLAAAGSNAPNEYFASDKEFSSSTNSVEHSVQIVGGTAANAPFNSNGLPIFQNAVGSGTLLATANNATVGQLTYTITSLTIAPTTLSITPASFTYPNTLVSTQTPPLPVTITNNSTNDVSISAVGLSPDNGTFSIAANNCVVLAPKASCTVSVIFQPYQVGVQQTSLTIADNAQGSPQTVSLSGTATVAPAPVITPSTTELMFSNQQVGTASGERAVTIKNTGNAPLSIFSIKVDGAQLTGAQPDVFKLRSACGPTLVPGQACTVFVTFLPVVAGLASANLSISANLSELSGSRTIGIYGYGATVPVAGVTLSTTTLSFASQTTGTASVKQSVNLTNTGAAPVKIPSITLAGEHAADFVLQNACVPTLAVGQRCSIFVTFKPQTAGDLSAAVIIASSAGSAGSVVTLTGTATPATAPVLTLSTTNLDFSNQQVGTASAARAINLTNSGTAPLSLSSIVLVPNEGLPDYWLVKNACVPILAPGQHCTVFVSFTPKAGGSIFANVIINDNAQVAQQSVQVAGTAF
jgi:hypothetical protein